MPIAVDAMGGDFAPRQAVEGAVRAAVEDGAAILLVGDKSRVEAALGRGPGQGKLGQAGRSRDGSAGSRGAGRIVIVHAEEVVGMDEPAITPIRKKRRSSIRICAEVVKDRRAQAMVTAGHTGVLDVGANVDSKPEHLREFAVMGHFYAQEVVGTPAPRIGLLSIGEEEGKGTDLTREVFKALKTTGLNFVGNVEGRDVFNGAVDVVVCDGFVGNVIPKRAEALAELVGKMLREELGRSARTKLGYLLAKPAFDRFRQRVDYTAYGAAPPL